LLLPVAFHRLRVLLFIIYLGLVYTNTILWWEEARAAVKKYIQKVSSLLFILIIVVSSVRLFWSFDRNKFRA